MAEPGIRVHGLRELQRAFAQAEKDARANVRGALRVVAEPVRRDAESRASQFAGTRWARMRIGITRSAVYVAPATRRTVGTARPNFGTMLMDDAMDPALEQHRFGLEVAVGKALDEMSNDWEK